MRKLALILAFALLVLPAIAQSNSCLRVMPIEEMVRSSIFIGRIKVMKIDRVRYRGEYGQLAQLAPVDVIDGDYMATNISVLANANVRCASDNYIKHQEMLVFLEPEDSLLRTINYQYGQFPIVEDVVKGWRDKNNKPCDKPYGEVRNEILRYIEAARKPPGQNIKQPPQQLKPPPLVQGD
jgi:hypothetical protein